MFARFKHFNAKFKLMTCFITIYNPGGSKNNLKQTLFPMKSVPLTIALTVAQR
jgi:hypothetical protein